MTARVSTLRCWQDASPALLAGQGVVVIDVLRWSTVVVTALSHGASRVEAFLEPEDALDRAHALGRTAVLLGGERGNVALPGFDVGNSPLEYTPERVRARAVLSTTTNGTQALLAASDSRAVLVGAFVNLSATVLAVRSLLGQGTPVTLLASGTSGHEALEDTACAGAIAERLRDLAESDEATQRAIATWREHATAARVIAASPHAASLRATGHEADLAVASLVDSHEVVARAAGNVVRR